MKKVLSIAAMALTLCLCIFGFSGCKNKDPDPVIMYEVTASFDNGVYQDKEKYAEIKQTEIGATEAVNVFWQDNKNTITEIITDKAGNVLKETVMSTTQTNAYNIVYKGGKIYRAFLVSDKDNTTYLELTKFDENPTLIYPKA